MNETVEDFNATCPKWWQSIGHGPFHSTDEIRAANQAVGHHWFDPETMRFFGTRVSFRVYGGRFFVASHQPPHGPRVYAVHVASDEGKVENESDVLLSDSPLTYKQAHARARHLAEIVDYA